MNRKLQKSNSSLTIAGLSPAIGDMLPRVAPLQCTIGSAERTDPSLAGKRNLLCKDVKLTMLFVDCLSITRLISVLSCCRNSLSYAYSYVNKLVTLFKFLSCYFYYNAVIFMLDFPMVYFALH